MREAPLGDLLDVLIDHRGKTPTKLGSAFVRTGIPVASAINIKAGRLLLDSPPRCVTEAVYARWMPVPLREGDVLLTSEAPLGEVARVPSDTPLVLGQRLFGLRGRRGVLDSGFLFYALQWRVIRERINSRSTGTTVYGISQAELVRVLVPLPPFSEQRAIAEVLGALDDKIEADCRLVSGLRNLNVALYQRSLEDGAALEAMADIADFHNRNRVPLSSRERCERPGDYPYYGAAGVVDYIDAFLFDGVYLLVGEDGTVLVDDRYPMVQYVWGQFWVNNHAHVLTGRGISTELLRASLVGAEIADSVTGAVQPKLNMGNLKRVRVLIPQERGRLEERLSALGSQERAAVAEIQLLTSLRDTLLPKLLSGDLQIDDPQAAIEAAV